MVVLSITNCPPRLRGDLSKWLMEINTGVYIGRVSARVREELWLRICENIRDGQATMIYSAANAQGYQILVHNTCWEPVDYDGITLMKRPLKQERGSSTNNLSPGFSNAAKYEKARKRTISAAKKEQKNSYVVLDLETTGLDCETDRILEIGALRVVDGLVEDKYHGFIRQDQKIPEKIIQLTGISDAVVQADGENEKEAIEKLLAFVGTNLVIGYNVKFDIGFLQKSCERQGIDNSIRKTKDVLALSRRKIEDIGNYRLDTVGQYLGLEISDRHRALNDCELVFRIYTKLNEI